MAKYHVPVLEKFQWQQPVIDKDLTSPPADPSKGDRYLIYGTGSGDWTGHDNDIAYYDGSAWQFIDASEGMHVWVKDEDKIYVFDGTSWSEEGSGTGDMLKSTYDTDNDGIVDKAESIDDGTYSATAQEIKDAVDKRHTAGSETLGGSLAGTVSDARLASGNDADKPASPEVGDVYIATDTDKVYKCISAGTWSLIKNLDLSGNNVNDLADITSSGSDIEDAVSKKHTQDTDQYLDYGGSNQISAAQAKEAYDRRATYVAEYEALEFDNL